VTKKPKICLIYTGGTIGMKKQKDGTLMPPEDPGDFLRMAPVIDDIVDYDFVPLLNKDSTNIIPSDWQKMAKAIHERRDLGYAGFVVAHGTDTMHFSASAIAFALGDNLNFPVVFTGAQTIPDIPHGDARINLIRACKVATTDIAEVVISFGDYVFRGCRAQKKDERRFDAFESPALPPLAYITEEIIIGPLAKRKKYKTGEIILKAEFAENILQVSLIPGLEPELLEPVIEKNECRGIILQSFGAGNVPDTEEYSFVEFIKKAKEKNIPLIVTSQFPANATLHSAYAPGKAAVAAGAIPTGNMTASCAVAKFRWILATVNQDIKGKRITGRGQVDKVKRLMQQIFVREMDKK